MRWSPVLMGASWARLAQTATQSAPRNLFRPFVQACTSDCVTMSDHLPADITHKPGCNTTANRRQVETHGRCLIVMPPEGPPSTPSAAISTVRRGWPACAGHDDEGAPSTSLNLPAVCYNSYTGPIFPAAWMGQSS